MSFFSPRMSRAWYRWCSVASSWTRRWPTKPRTSKLNKPSSKTTLTTPTAALESSSKFCRDVSENSVKAIDSFEAKSLKSEGLDDTVRTKAVD